MASTYSTDLSLELVTTGEKAGLWGSITNTNLQLLQIKSLKSITFPITITQNIINELIKKKSDMSYETKMMYL